MKNLIKLTAVFLFTLVSCSGDGSKREMVTADTSSTNTKTESDPGSSSGSISDRSALFAVDDYPITDDMLGNGVNAREIARGEIVSLDKAWFTNDSLQQSIVIELATDNFRMNTFHFRNDDVPRSLIEKMQLVTKDREPASLKEKEKSFEKFLNSARELSSRYFVSNKGFRLGHSKDKIIEAYGVADSSFVENGMQVLHWKFIGENLSDSNNTAKDKPLAKDSYGHHATMYFRNDRLIALTFHNEIP